jgi:hypothetical protein
MFLFAVIFEKWWINKCVDEEDEAKISPSDFGVIVEWVPKFLPKVVKKDQRKAVVELMDSMRKKADHRMKQMKQRAGGPNVDLMEIILTNWKK